MEDDIDITDEYLNDKIDKNPDDYLYLHELVLKKVEDNQLEYIKNLFEKIPNILKIIDLPELLCSNNDKEMVKFLYDELLKFDDEIFLIILEEHIKDLQEDNPNMLIIEYHKENK